MRKSSFLLAVVALSGARHAHVLSESDFQDVNDAYFGIFSPDMRGLDIVASPRHLKLTTVVNTENELIHSAAVDGVIQLGSTIRLSETVKISERDSLTINGNSFAIDGNLSVRCLWINSSVVYLNELTITNCYSNFSGGGLLIKQSFLYIMRCRIIGNIVGPRTEDITSSHFNSSSYEDEQYFMSQMNGGGMLALNSFVLSLQSDVINNSAVRFFFISFLSQNW